MAIEGTIRIHRSIGGTGAAFRVSFVPYDTDGESTAVAIFIPAHSTITLITPTYHRYHTVATLHLTPHQHSQNIDTAKLNHQANMQH
jgi:hypothetical protein